MSAATLPTVAPAPPAGATRRPLALPALTLVLTAALGYLVAADGTPVWQVVRVAVVAAVGTAAVLVARRGGPRPRGWSAVCFGLAGLVAGIGIGPAHVTKAGVTPIAVAGLVALLAGLAVAIGGGVVLVRAARGRRRLLAVPVVAAIAQFLLLPLPQSVAATNVPPTAVGRTPAAVGLAYEEVRFATRDGVTLAAWYVPSTTGVAVVLLHGAGSTRSAVLDHAAVLARHGYGVLLVDARGHGDSGGRAMDFGWYGVADVDGAVTYLVGRSDVDGARIAAVGMSMGGEEALTAAATDPRIRAVVAEGVGRRSPADLGSVPGGVRGAVQRVVEWTAFAGADVLSDAHPPIGLDRAVAATAPRPVLLIAGRGEISTARHYRAAAPGFAAVWELPATAHTRGLADHRAEWTARVTGLLDSALR